MLSGSFKSPHNHTFKGSSQFVSQVTQQTIKGIKAQKTQESERHVLLVKLGKLGPLASQDVTHTSALGRAPRRKKEALGSQTWSVASITRRIATSDRIAKKEVNMLVLNYSE